MMKQNEEIELVRYLESQSQVCSTAAVGDALDISVYQARYRLRKLCRDGTVMEIKQGRGVSSLWYFCGEAQSLDEQWQ